MKPSTIFIAFFLFFIMTNCNEQNKVVPVVDVYETSANGHNLTKISTTQDTIGASHITIDTAKKFQTITGFGGSFTEASAYLLNNLSKQKRDTILKAYFSQEGANYSLTRTHIASCDFSLSNYTYAKVENDMQMEHFSIEDDKDDLIPMILDAKAISNNGFKIISSPWSCPPWMKDNKNYVGGKLLPEFNDAFALYFSKYLEAYKKEGIDIWGVTVINEPHGNGNNWESTHFSPEEMTLFVQKHLGPKLELDGWKDVKIFGYDQNRAGLPEWVDAMYKNEETSKYFDGTAIHWYESTYEVFPEALQYAHQKAPDKLLIETEGCIDAEVPRWKDDKWYWSKEATDWGWDWASEEEKYLHPKYAPVHRYARDIIGCLNNWVDGWVDWNMVLDKQGGPNWFKNWCIAPVIVDIETDEVYFTPLYYTMAHFSKFIRPGAVIVGVDNDDKSLMVTAAQNPDNSIAIVVFNEENIEKKIKIEYQGIDINIKVSPQAIQTIIVKN
jgi:glucosylceramidase